MLLQFIFKFIYVVVALQQYVHSATKFNISTWYVGGHDTNSFPIEKIRWDIITHIHNRRDITCRKTKKY